MPPERTLFTTAVDSVSVQGQKLTPQKDGSMMISRMADGVEMPIATLHPANNGGSVIIENAFGQSQPMNNIVMVKQSLGRMGVSLNRATEVAGVTERAGPQEVAGPREVN